MNNQKTGISVSGLPLCFAVLLLFFPVASFSQADAPSDKAATKETAALYKNLKKLPQKGFLFGHQDDLAYGVNWKYLDGRSDVKDVTGDYPAVYGWELGHIEIDQPVNLDSVPFAKMEQYIKKIYAQGGIVTISWHLNNPLTGKSAWEPAAGTVASVLSGGSSHLLFTSWLDKVAAFLLRLKGTNGELIPVIFRPFHELNGNWFWWGGKNCTPEEFKKLWIFTVDYFRNEKKLHHLLYAYNTDRFLSREEYLLKYPGDEWVDIIGFDIYQRNTSNEKFVSDIGQMFTTLETIAAEKNKIPALTEFGGNLSDTNWWSDVFLKALQPHHPAYVLAWRNAGKKVNGEFEYYVPYKGEASQNSFVTFYQNQQSLFQQEVTKEKLYQK